MRTIRGTAEGMTRGAAPRHVLRREHRRQPAGRPGAMGFVAGPTTGTKCKSGMGGGQGAGVERTQFHSPVKRDPRQHGSERDDRNECQQ